MTAHDDTPSRPGLETTADATPRPDAALEATADATPRSDAALKPTADATSRPDFATTADAPARPDFATTSDAIASLRPLLAAALDVADIDPQRRLFDLGMTSLHAMRLAAELARTLGRPVAPTLFWAHPTLAALAAHLVHGEPGPRATVIPAAAAEPIAIVGMACRFPRAPDLAAFWRLLADGVDATTDVPPDRWDVARFHDPDPAAPGAAVTRRGAFLDDVRGFDPLFFGISPREADELDPQQRLALELAWEALEDAGVPPRGLAGSATAVFFASMWHDWSDLGRADIARMSAHRATGAATNMIANRVSYALGLRGPSLVLDTACSSALVAVHLASQALLAGDADLALVGAVNLLLAPESMVFCSKFGGLAPDGRCKTFDARADGFGRGEGGGVVVLKRLSRARADGDRVWAVLRGAAVNNDGASQGLTAPSPRAQEEVLRAALARAGVAGREVHHVEAHGTGTLLGDPIEAAALGAVLGEDRPPDRPLLVGSVKTNIGHTEGAAGIAGLIKTTLALHHRAVPPSLHLERPSPHIDLDALRLRVPTALEPWPAPLDAPALAGVSAFGWGGTNAHVVLEGYAPEPRWFALAADDAPALHAALRRLRDDAARGAWADLACPDGPLGPHRFAAVARSPHELRARLDAALGDATPHDLSREPAHLSREPAPRDLPPLTSHVTTAPAPVFVCSPLGSQWRGMARQLLQSEPAFRAAIARCDRAFLPLLKNQSIRADLLADWHDEDDVVRAQPLLFSVQVALAALLRSWGVVPAAVLGHSAGEIAAAHIAGILDLEQAAEVVTHYARVQRPTSGRGAMAVVALPAADLLKRKRLGDRVVIAAHNSATSTVISGEAAAVAAVVAALQAEGVACSQIRSDVAGHSPLVRDGLTDLTRALADLRPAAAAIPFISAVTGGPLERPGDGAYWACNLGQPVRFQSAVEHLLAAGHALFIEIGPHPVVSHAILECAAQTGRPARVLPTLRRGPDERLPLLTTRAALFLAGLGDEPPAPAELFVLSARSPAALAQATARAADWLDRHPLAAADLAHTAALRRSHLEHRRAVVGRTREELAAALRRADPPAPAAPRPRVVFVFPGQGSQWPGMARALFADEPAFRARLRACDRALAPHFAGSVIDELHASPERSRLDRSDVVQPVLWAVTVALAGQWRAWGVVPDAVVGHSMGEVAAACVAGALDLDDGARIVAARSRIARAHAGGAMAVVELALPDALDAIADVADRLVVGVHNGPRECVLSGDADALAATLTRLEVRGVFCRRVRVDYASHGPHMAAIRDPLLAALAGIAPRPGAVPMLSTLRGDWQPGEALDPEYWADNIRERVRFADAIDRLLATSPPGATWRGHPRVFLEVSPHPLLAAAIRDMLPPGAGHRVLGSLRRDEDGRASLLTTAAALFESGVDLDLAALHPDGGRVVALPGVPWQRTPHWLAPPSTAPPPRRRDGHPILGVAFTTPAHPGSHVFTATLSAATLPYLADHRVDDRPIVPGATWLDLALTAAALVHPGPRALRDIVFHEPLVLPQDGAEIQVALTDPPDGAHFFKCFGRAAESWSCHVSGRIDLRPVPADMPRTQHVPADMSLRADAPPVPTDMSAAPPVPADSFYAALARRGLDYGPRCRGVTSIRASSGHIAAELAPPPGSAAPGALVLPVLLDAALHALVAGLPDDGRPLVPIAISALHVDAPLTTACSVTGRIDPDTLRGDLEVRDLAGRVVLTVEALQLRRLAAPRVRDDELLTLAWRELPPAPPPATRPHRWLLAPARGELATRLADLLRADGDEVHALAPGDDPAPALAAGPWDGVVHLAAGTDLRADAAPLLWTHALDATTECLTLVQAALRARGRDLPRLVLVTRGAAADAVPRALAQAPLWGLGLTLAYEHPELRCLRVDLSPDPRDVELRALATALRAPDSEDQIALRGDRRLGARLVRGSFTPGPAIDLSPGTVLISGGLGDLGLALAARLVARGCRRIALLGRGGPSRPEQHAALARLAAAGAHVTTHAVDVADHDALAAVIAALPTPLVGVFHAAGVLDDAVIAHQDRDHLARVMAPKICGAWNLHLLTRDLPLRCFVLFSSVAALVGSPGQSNYAAANAFLDALAAHRRALALPALAVQWGAVAEVGLAARDERRGARLAARGMRPLPVERALDHLERLLADPDLTTIAVAPLDLRQWLEFHLAVASAPYFAELRTTAPAPALDLAATRRDLAALDPDARLRAVDDLVRAQVLQVLRVAVDRVHRHTSLLDLGLDSLTGLELRNRLESALGLRLPASLAWTYPRLDVLAAHLDARLADATTPPPEMSLTPSPAPTAETPRDSGLPTSDDLSALSDEELLRALSAELER